VGDIAAQEVDFIVGAGALEGAGVDGGGNWVERAEVGGALASGSEASLFVLQVLTRCRLPTRYQAGGMV
jgi:hypothetical protein